MSTATSESHRVDVDSSIAVRHESMLDTRPARYDNISVTGGVAHFGDNYYCHPKELANGYEVHKFNELVRSLPSLGFDAKHEAAYDQCMLGTGQWFLDSVQVKRWLSGLDQILWCPGIPGAGKTCMASIVIQHLRTLCGENTEHAIAYIYFDYGNRDQHTPRALFGDLLAQILRNQSSLSRTLLNKYEETGKVRTPLTKDHLLSLLAIAAKSYEKVFIVVDALDECTEKQRRSIITSLRNIGPEISLLITSRPIGTIAELFEHVPKQDIYAADHDMASYVRKQIVEDVDLSKMVEEDLGLEQEIVTALVDKAQNMFLLVRLHLQSLSTILTKNKVRKALKVLPQKLDQTYDRALKRIREQVADLKTLGLNVLMWLMMSMRPMSLTELHHALSVEPEQQRFVKDDLIDNLHMLASSCAGLVVMDRKANTIGLVHYTTQEYLAQRMAELHTRPHATIATACLTYLQYEDFGRPTNRDDLLERLPFAAYAARYWGWHLAQADDLEPQLQDQAVSLLRKKARVTDIFMIEPSHLEASDADNHRSFINRAKPNGLHVAAHFGLHAAFQTLISEGGSLDCRDGHGNTPLHYAAWTGQVSILRLYQRESADIMILNDHPSWRSVPLQCAAVNGQAGFVAELIAVGADVNYNLDRSLAAEVAEPPMHEAIHHDQLQVVQKLCELGADVDLCSAKSGTTPLDVACDRVRSESIELLLRCGASLDGEKGHRALSRLVCRDYRESPKQYVEAMALLHRSQVNLNRTLEYGYRVLDYELSFGRGQMIETLLDAGAQPALTWYVDQPAVRRWINEHWFAQLQKICTDSQQARLMSDELEQVVVVRTRNVEGSFTMDPDTHSVAWGLYYMWPRPLLVPGGMQSLDEKVFTRIRPYLRIEIPQNMVQVTKIVVTIESHDQGYTTCYTTFDKYANGTYNLSFTWFDLLFYYHKHPEHPIWQDLVQFNVNASSDWKTHTNTWDVEDLTDSRACARADAIWQLRPGDSVMLYARAFFPCWENHVRMAEVRIEGLRKKQQ